MMVILGRVSIAVVVLCHTVFNLICSSCQHLHFIRSFFVFNNSFSSSVSVVNMRWVVTFCIITYGAQLCQVVDGKHTYGTIKLQPYDSEMISKFVFDYR